MMDNWLRTIITSLDKKERLRKLERFLYRWNIWTETNLEIDNPFYLYDMLSDMSVSSNTTELFVNFKNYTVSLQNVQWNNRAIHVPNLN